MKEKGGAEDGRNHKKERVQQRVGEPETGQKRLMQEPKRQTEDPGRRQSNAESGDSCGS